MPEVENARIKSIWIGIEFHGVPVINIELQGKSWVQGTGSFDLRGMDFASALESLLRITERDSLRESEGQPVRIERDDVMILRLGHLFEEKWMDFRQHYPRKGEENVKTTRVK